MNLERGFPNNTVLVPGAVLGYNLNLIVQGHLTLLILAAIILAFDKAILPFALASAARPLIPVNRPIFGVLGAIV